MPNTARGWFFFSSNLAAITPTHKAVPLWDFSFAQFFGVASATVTRRQKLNRLNRTFGGTRESWQTKTVATQTSTLRLKLDHFLVSITSANGYVSVSWHVEPHYAANPIK